MCEYLQVYVKKDSPEYEPPGLPLFVALDDNASAKGLPWSICDSSGNVLKSHTEFRREDVLKCHRAILHEGRNVLVPV